MPQFWKAPLQALLAAAALMATLVPGHAQKLNAGLTNSASDVPFFIADKRGYFKAEGLEVELIRFDSAAKMMAPLGTGEIDVASGATSSALYNAFKRGVLLRIVSDKAKNAPEHGFQAIMVRKDLIDSGKVKSMKDFKGLKVAVSAAGNSESFLVDYALRKGGMTIADVEPVYLGFPQHVAAYANGGIDASLTVEPTLSTIVKAGTAVRFAGIDQIYPNFQTAVIFYSEKFAKEQPEQAKKFMRALIHAARDYNDALEHGHLTGPGADDVIKILTEYSFVKDPAVHRAITSQYFDPNGDVNVASLKDAWQFFKDTKQIDGSVRVDQVVDLSFAKWAADSLGPYTKKKASN